VRIPCEDLSVRIVPFLNVKQTWATRQDRQAGGPRVEWFRDDHRTRVGGIGAPKGWTLWPDIAVDQIGWAGDFYEISLGLNWTPRTNIIVRPECRWDWYRGPVDGAGNFPYYSGSLPDQFTFATDLIATF